MKTKPRLVKRGFNWFVDFGRASYMCVTFKEARIKARWLWWHQPKWDLK